MKDRKTQRAAENQIDENLRRIFEQDVEQDLPERLRALLEDLDRDDEDNEGGGGDAGGSVEGGGGASGPDRSAHAGAASIPAGQAAAAMVASSLSGATR